MGDYASKLGIGMAFLNLGMGMMPSGGGYPSGIMASLKSILPGFQRPMPESVEVLKDGTRVPYDSRDPGRFGVTDDMRPPPIDWKKTKLGKYSCKLKGKKHNRRTKKMI